MRWWHGLKCLARNLANGSSQFDAGGTRSHDGEG